MPSFWVTGTTRFKSVDIICQIWPIRGYTRSWYTGTGRLKKWLQAPPPLLSPVSSRFTYVFALSQFSGPNYLGAWNRLLPQELQTRFDLSSARNILLVIQHFHTYSFLRITSKEPVCFFSETSSRFQYDPPENQIWHTDDSYLSEKEKASFFLCWSSFQSFRSKFSDRRHNTGFGDKSIVFLNLGQAS